MHRAESILVAITAAITGLATTGANVQRGYAEQLAGLPGLIVKMGPDSATINNVTKVDRILRVMIESSAKADETTDTTFNQIRAEVYAALMAAPKFGLGYVIDTELVIDEEPEQKNHEIPIVKQVMLFDVFYRHSYASTEA